MVSFFTKRNVGVFKFLRFEERIRKAPISVDKFSGLSADGRPNPWNKASFSNLPNVVWNGPSRAHTCKNIMYWPAREYEFKRANFTCANRNSKNSIKNAKLLSNIRLAKSKMWQESHLSSVTFRTSLVFNSWIEFGKYEMQRLNR